MIFSKTGLEIFIHRKPIDMQFGFHKLTGLIREKHGMPKILDGHVFMHFCKSRTRLKALFFDGRGRYGTFTCYYDERYRYGFTLECQQ